MRVRQRLIRSWMPERSRGLVKSPSQFLLVKIREQVNILRFILPNQNP